MRAADLATAAVMMLLGGVVIYDALRLGIGWGTDGPRSGFFPFWLAVALMGIGAVVFGRALWRADREPLVATDQGRRVLAVLAPAAALVGLTEVIGLYVAAALYLGFYMRWMGRHRWSLVAAVALGVPLALFVVFERWFLVPMPKGPLEAWLGY